MSITTTKDVFCDCCPVWVHCGTQINNVTAWKIAKSQGWIRKRVGNYLIDLCPKCKDK